MGTIVSRDKWRDAIKFLMGQGCNPTLTNKDQRVLKGLCRGPFTNGMSQQEAQATLIGLGWKQEGSS